MKKKENVRDVSIPKNWDRRGLPSWAYHNENLLKIEEEELFHKHWQLICHQSDLNSVGDFITFDICDVHYYDKMLIQIDILYIKKTKFLEIFPGGKSIDFLK